MRPDLVHFRENHLHRNPFHIGCGGVVVIAFQMDCLQGGPGTKAYSTCLKCGAEQEMEYIPQHDTTSAV